MERIEVLEVLKPQGIKGEIKFRSLVEEDSLLESVNEFFIGERMLTISTIRTSSGFVYIKFNEINSIEDAEKLRGQFVFVDKAKIKESLAEGEYFLSDLIGKQIVFEDGNILGEITDIQNFGSADVFYILKTNGKEVLFSNVDGVIMDVSEDKVVINKKKFDEVSV